MVPLLPPRGCWHCARTAAGRWRQRRREWQTQQRFLPNVARLSACQVHRVRAQSRPPIRRHAEDGGVDDEASGASDVPQPRAANSRLWADGCCEYPYGPRWCLAEMPLHRKESDRGPSTKEREHCQRWTCGDRVVESGKGSTYCWACDTAWPLHVSPAKTFVFPECGQQDLHGHFWPECGGPSLCGKQSRGWLSATVSTRGIKEDLGFGSVIALCREFCSRATGYHRRGCHRSWIPRSGLSVHPMRFQRCCL